MHARLPLRRRPLSALRALLDSEAAGGLVLMGSAALALVLANSPLRWAYDALVAAELGGVGLAHVINDGLMAIFFLLVGLEIKREMLDGHLATWPRRALPGIAALGGMIVPALIFVALNWGDGLTLRGWAIPSATDIAFALGVLALLGPRVPVSLKVFVTALAILDDLGAVLIIALVYTAHLSGPMLGGAALAFAALIALNRAGVERLWPYLAIGAVLWAFVLRSGVHATVAGVAVALTIPLRPSPGRPEEASSPLHILEHALQPWAAYFILPVFGFVNAGVAFADLDPSEAVAPLTLGVGLGLLVGKQVGVFVAAYGAIRLRLAAMPAHASAGQLYGVALLCGIGFTMSLFIGHLAFPDSPDLMEEVKVGVLMGSLASALAGWLVLRQLSRRPRPVTPASP